MKTLEYVADARTVRLGASVRAVLPKLAADSHRRTGATLCPTCGDHKTSDAKHCRACYSKHKRIAEAIGRSKEASPRPTDFRQARSWRPGRVGVTPVQPRRSLLVKQADGSWLPEE